MQVKIEVEGETFHVDVSRAFDLSIPLTFDREDGEVPQPRAFHLPRARATALREVRQGGGCNCDTIRLTPHGNGTHTEGVGHISRPPVPLPPLLEEAFLAATVVTSRDPGGAISAGHLVAVEEARPGFLQAVVVRTRLPHPDGPFRNWSGTHPPYFTVEAIRYLRGLGVRHLVTDLPSLDPEEDEGRLSAHHAFWEETSAGTVTEMAWIPDTVPDGSYFLSLQIPNLMLDAVPSRPLLFEVVPHVA